MSTAAQTVKRWKPGGVYMYDLEAMSMADCDEMTFVSWEDYTALGRRVQELRAALVGLIGVDGREELEAMEAFIRLTPAPAADKAAAVDAIHVLLATLPAPPDAGGV